MAKMTGEELRRRYADGERNFSGVDLSGAMVTGSVSDEDFFVAIDLRGIDFSRANLSGADLSGANFTEANFSGANLKRCWMYKCDLTRANFTQADLTQATMTESFMKYTDFTEANLRESSVSNFGLSPNLTDAKNLHTVTNYSTLDGDN